MIYQKECPKCRGRGYEEFQSGTILISCSECDGAGKIPLAIPEQKEGYYFCVQCEKSHKEDSKVGISHLQFKAEAQTETDE